MPWFLDLKLWQLYYNLGRTQGLKEKVDNYNNKIIYHILNKAPRQHIFCVGP